MNQHPSASAGGCCHFGLWIPASGFVLGIGAELEGYDGANGSSDASPDGGTAFNSKHLRDQDGHDAGECGADDDSK